MDSMKLEHAIIFHSRISRRLLDDIHRPDKQPPSAYTHSTVTLSFALGTILVLLFILTITTTFSCLCYYCSKMRRAGRTAFLRRNSIAAIDGLPSTPDREGLSLPGSESYGNSIKVSANVEKANIPSLPVVMPGDNIPKFIAWPCSYMETALQSSEKASSNELPISETPPPKPS